jgi:ABC-type nitrate/sulfonate/bicarbonate transport system substrate-binding protein
MAGRFLLSSWLAVFLLVDFQVPAAFAQVKITVGYAAVSPRTVPLIIAQEQGLFVKNGIESRLILIRGEGAFVVIVSVKRDREI